MEYVPIMPTKEELEWLAKVEADVAEFLSRQLATKKKPETSPALERVKPVKPLPDPRAQPRVQRGCIMDD